MAVVALGGGRRLPTDTIDHAVGFTGLAGLGARVDPKTPLAIVHARDDGAAIEAERRLIAAYTIGDSAASHPLIADRIDPPESP
jgi:thymidine phosphorylase